MADEQEPPEGEQSEGTTTFRGTAYGPQGSHVFDMAASGRSEARSVLAVTQLDQDSLTLGKRESHMLRSHVDDLTASQKLTLEAWNGAQRA